MVYSGLRDRVHDQCLVDGSSCLVCRATDREVGADGLIFIYCGGVGSGKSYHAVTEILYYLRRGLVVVANFQVRVPDRWGKRFVYVDNEELTPERLIRVGKQFGFLGREAQALLVIDEAQLLFNARDWHRDHGRRMQWIRFMTQSRKLGYNVVLIAQDPRAIDRQIRDIADQVVRHFKLNGIWWLFWLPLPTFVVAYKWNHSNLDASRDLVVLRPWIARRYETTAVFDAARLESYVLAGGVPDGGEGDQGERSEGSSRSSEGANGEQARGASAGRTCRVAGAWRGAFIRVASYFRGQRTREASDTGSASR